ncbi:Vacuolar basic amino acid transporter 2 [Wickerhamomyces ciferrii]|uniref:Vacuolar basic amino acid transporter 2 n=1 Tax=Wickerhamomyces ciferrii (strain ATCC 14091 / BCRC 22168 / CBS 111 / JCM 3599 / NBRC 0793 / NRRL Y-1031 F-60-10) TaxID=1206466 RepID=K0KJT1_WICCF|nr:Vacuolar basic amino acid transporter 2 [Wickerhamomyces ciferrii]CCH45520.1 Vacuolar basic amino acid transporter 2 [Wickerhamomyces ciferrii]
MSYKSRKLSTTESVLLLASEDFRDLQNNQIDNRSLNQDDDLESGHLTNDINAYRNYQTIEDPIQEETNQDITDEESISIFQIKNLYQIEVSLLLNVLLAAFDGTITASTYTIIGSEFNAVNLGSWITTSYLITSTSFQPLYGAFSDVFGRRVCYFFATAVFAIGCIGCSLSSNIFQLFAARALTGCGGGGLITLATVINSDIIPSAKRGLFQGFQNILIGIGSVLGAALGGLLSEQIGWRYCFAIQVPISITGLIFGFFYIENQLEFDESKGIKDIDIEGSLLLVTGLTAQLLALNTSSYTLTLFSFIILLSFIKIEFNTNKIPIIPFKKIHGAANYLVLFISILTGFANFAYIFILPLLFQIVLNDSPSTAGLRLGIPSLFTSVGSLITAYFMNENVNNLIYLVHAGVLLLTFGNLLAFFISIKIPEKLINFLLIPANAGLGMSNPALLFSFILQFPKALQASSTSTLYLFRSIGQVWGVATISIIIQWFLKFNLIKNFKDSDLGEDKINSIIFKVTRSISYIKTLPEDIQSTVKKSYETSIRNAQLIATLICVLCFLLCVFRDYLLSKDKKVGK